MLILASASPRRRELLRWLDVQYVVDPAVVDEEPLLDESAGDLVRRLARVKAEAVSERRPADWILGADTVVEIDGAVLGKPAHAAAARAMLEKLSGRKHRVFTGFALLRPGGSVAVAEVVVTGVQFRALSPAAIASYVASGEAEDKAGSYAVQGAGAAMVSSIEGSFTNVIGLPLLEVARALREVGLVGDG